MRVEPTAAVDEWLSGLPVVGGVHRQQLPDRSVGAARLYLEVRAREGRIYPDEVLRALPRTPPGHPLAAEWRWRARSVRRLADRLRSVHRPMTVLDVGCGNGWMSARLAELPGATVVGMDIVAPELEQAARVLGGAGGPRFVLGDFLGAPAPEAFDIVVFAASVHYFPGLREALAHAMSLLRPGGEVHVLDSPFYDDESSVEAARERSMAYYASLGVPAYAANYHHHLLRELEQFRPVRLYDPGSIGRKALGAVHGHEDSPFPWFVIAS